MRVIKNEQIVEDGWQLVADEQAVPAGDVIVSLDRWQGERANLSERSGKLGVVIDGATKLEELADDLKHFDLIALDFAKYGDGRCFSHARLLRERHGYQGELRAIGQVTKDFLFFMRRCGIDSFAVREDQNPQDALNAFGEFTVKYQTAADQAPPIYRLR
jgi:uncharacterized protein (DUF934 family)